MPIPPYTPPTEEDHLAWVSAQVACMLTQVTNKEAEIVAAQAAGDDEEVAYLQWRIRCAYRIRDLWQMSHEYATHACPPSGPVADPNHPGKAGPSTK